MIVISRNLVGAAGFEPATPSSRTWCSARLIDAIGTDPWWIVAAIIVGGRRPTRLRPIAGCRTDRDGIFASFLKPALYPNGALIHVMTKECLCRIFAVRRKLVALFGP